MTVYGGDFKGLLLELKKNCLKPRPGSFKQLLQLVPNATLVKSTLKNYSALTTFFIASLLKN